MAYCRSDGLMVRLESDESLLGLRGGCDWRAGVLCVGVVAHVKRACYFSGSSTGVWDKQGRAVPDGR